LLVAFLERNSYQETRNLYQLAVRKPMQMLVVYAAWVKNASTFKTVGGMDNSLSCVYSATSNSGKTLQTS